MTARDLYFPARNTIWTLGFFAGSWQCRQGLLLFKSHDSLKSPSVAIKELPLSSLEGTSLNAFIKGHPEKFPDWLIRLENRRTTYFQARLTRNCKQSCLNFCRLLFQIAHLWDFLLSKVNRENPLQAYYTTASRYMIELFGEFSRLLQPYHEGFRSECISRRLFNMVQFVDCLYKNSDLLIGAKCAFFKVPFLLPRPLNGPAKSVSCLLVAPKESNSRGFTTAWCSLMKSLRQVHIPMYLNLLDRIEQSIFQARKATGFSPPVVEKGKTRIEWTCVSIRFI